jgi:hypothetical protein
MFLEKNYVLELAQNHDARRSAKLNANRCKLTIVCPSQCCIRLSGLCTSRTRNAGPLRFPTELASSLIISMMSTPSLQTYRVFQRIPPLCPTQSQPPSLPRPFGNHRTYPRKPAQVSSTVISAACTPAVTRMMHWDGIK